MQDKKVEQDLKENLLAEYKSQVNGRLSLIGDTSNNEKLEEMEKREGRERYVDIVNVHAAAAN